MSKTLDQLIVHEGMRGNYYKCTAGKKTIGIGRNVDAKPFTEEEIKYLGRQTFSISPMTRIEAKWLLAGDVDKCDFQLLERNIIHGLSALNEARKAVCTNMVYNMGISGFCKFKKMIAAINNQDFKTASVEMLDSRWAKQVGNRSKQLSTQMATGVFHDG